MRRPRHPPETNGLLAGLSSADELASIFEQVSGPTHEGKYLHWEDVRQRPAPSGLSHEKWWLGLKMRRQTQSKAIPLTDVDGKPFVYSNPEQSQSLLHEITQRASGSMGASDEVTNPETRDRYLIRNLREEGITSSLIEGASTTREVAKEMLRSGRPPLGEGEQMVMNNFMAMQYIIDLGQTPLTPEVVFRLHEIVTRNTLEDPTAAGRFRRGDERIDVVDPSDNQILHDPPPAEQLPGRLAAMCAFANGEAPEGFVHPVVRSVLLHFWLAYDHPFKDGNGRCARALFYWSMLQHNYWLCQFLSISQVIRKAPTQYARAFLYSESDDNDLTYFLLHQLVVVQKAIDELHRYLDQKVAQRRALDKRLRLGTFLNERQLDLVAHAVRHPNARYDIRQHQANHGVVYQTARTDLMGLADKGVFLKTKIGKTFYFHPKAELETVLGSLQTSAKDPLEGAGS